MMLLYDDVTYPGPFGIDLSRKAATPGSKKNRLRMLGNIFVGLYRAGVQRWVGRVGGVVCA